MQITQDQQAFLTEVDQFNQSVHARAAHLKRNISNFEHELKALFSLKEALHQAQQAELLPNSDNKEVFQ